MPRPTRRPHRLHPPRAGPGPTHREGRGARVGHPGRGARPEEAREVTTSGTSERQAPEVDREWAADPPAPKPTPPAPPLLLLAGLALTLSIALGRATLATHPALFTLTFLVAGLCAGALLEELAWGRRSPERRALRGAIRAIGDGEHPVRIVCGLRLSPGVWPSGPVPSHRPPPRRRPWPTSSRRTPANPPFLDARPRPRPSLWPRRPARPSP